MPRPLRRRVPGFGVPAFGALVLAGMLGLTACAATPPALVPAPVPEEDPCAAPGESSDAIRVAGEFGASPRVDASGPFAVDRVERTVLVEGSGDAALPGDLVEVSITIVNATTGERAPETTLTRVLLAEGAVQPGLLATLVCSSPGTRIAAVVPSELAFGSVGQPELAIGPGDDLVLVVDVLAIVPLQATGTPVALPGDFPALGLRFDAAGRPTISVSSDEPPAATTSAVLREGSGPVVEPGDEFLVQFQAVNWRTGEVFDETWGDAPRSLLSVLPAVDAAIVGRTVGSRLVVVVPPADGFGPAGSPSSGIAATDTVVYVVDILATTPAPV